MTKELRSALLIFLLPVLVGCQMGPGWRLRQAQLRTYQVYRKYQGVNGQLAQSEMERQQLAQSLDVANQRLANLASERSMLHQQYQELLTSLPTPGYNPLGGAQSEQLAELARKYPRFEYDPATGVSRFNGDLLFSSGSDEIRSEGAQVLREFAKIMNQPEASQLHILVVGHTDSQPVVQPSTKARHETNWELSAHRATRVVRALAVDGISEPRLGLAGYNQYQPAAPNSSDSSRQLNRRVEIYILAPNAQIAARPIESAR
ncbi:MAG: OmpA family protein [Planctomycetaceae bacterium]|nr:OmpA family protein [Planctomycetaceae bacterium]MCB9951178.1 OmpA family protein [Planctomycetaceae bacterium]